jgi:hypothetical protein
MEEELIPEDQKAYPQRYLGDGVYGTFDGYQIWVNAERDGFIHRIALEMQVLSELRLYMEEISAMIKRERRRSEL